MSMYIPNQSKRHFTYDTLYSSIDWEDFAAVTKAFQDQLEYWYLYPGLALKDIEHSGFAVVSIACQLVDCLSQYEEGAAQANKNHFIEFLRLHWPELAVPFPVTIRTGNTSGAPTVDDAAAAIYFGLRCGVIHEAHPILYTCINGQSDMTKYHLSGLASYQDGTDCPVVSVDPGKFFDAIAGRLTSYLGELRDPAKKYSDLRQNFKKKFEKSYGVTISVS